MHTIRVDHFQRVYADGALICEHITRTEERVLRAIMTHSHVATKDYILSAVYGGRDEPEAKIIDVFVTKIRTKLGRHRLAIKTSWGRGYARGDGYEILPPDHQGVTVSIDAKLAEDVAFAAGEDVGAVVDRLLTAERERLWAVDTVDVAEVA